MEKIRMCEVCKQNEASESCSKCGIVLCAGCLKEVRVEINEPGQRIMGVSTSAMKAAFKKFKVCEKCMQEEDFI
jgi:hypothetical protein